jgi:DNA (cytosine-5)-methyltransferase 1
MSGTKPVPITVGCLFAAIGGFAKAFQQIGASVLWASEKDQFAIQTFRLNFPSIRCIEKDVQSLSVHGDHLEPVDILTAGFPCQPFSVAGEKLGFKDERGNLFREIIRLIREFGANKPKMLLLENVRNLKSHDRGRTFKTIQAEIQKAGYWFTDKNAEIMHTAWHTNIPQNRERLFMVALSCDHFRSNTFEFPEKFPELRLRTVFDYLDLDKKAEGWY